jgi:hypothetical protein
MVIVRIVNRFNDEGTLTVGNKFESIREERNVYTRKEVSDTDDVISCLLFKMRIYFHDLFDDELIYKKEDL